MPWLPALRIAWLLARLPRGLALRHPAARPAPLPPRRYFLHNWPHLCFLVFKGERCFGTVVAKMDVHRGRALRGYIAMLTVQREHRHLGVGEAAARWLWALTPSACFGVGWAGVAGGF